MLLLSQNDWKQPKIEYLSLPECEANDLKNEVRSFGLLSLGYAGFVCSWERYKKIANVHSVTDEGALRLA
jgi:hypothetical protein